MAWLPPWGNSRDELGRYHSLNMKATSAAMVPFAGSPDSRKQSKSSQFNTKGSVICPSVTCTTSSVGTQALLGQVSISGLKLWMLSCGTHNHLRCCYCVQDSGLR